MMLRLHWNFSVFICHLLYLFYKEFMQMIPFFKYCQAQPQSQLSWAELALLLISPAARPPHILRRHLHISCATTIQTSSEIAGNQLNLLCKICRSTPEHLKIILNILKMWKTTSREDDLRGIQPPGETTFK